MRQMWDNGTLINIHKKELLRSLIDKVVLHRPAADKCEARIIWKGGDWTTALLDLPVVTYAEMEKGEELIDEVVRRAQAGESDQQIAAELTAAGYHAPLKRRLGVESVRRIREKHGVSARRTEFQRHGLPGWISLGQAVRRLGEHTSWAYYLIRQGRLQIERDPEIGLYLVPDRKKPLKELKELLRGQRFSLIVERRSSCSTIEALPHVDRLGGDPDPHALGARVGGDHAVASAASRARTSSATRPAVIEPGSRNSRPPRNSMTRPASDAVSLGRSSRTITGTNAGGAADRWASRS
ncbi:hypothetical protein V5E97_19085 [Singulisphaera sp. Ch08]|uniref:Uncharacterized protein n=1 Tax=Singulisphaera sp. Ch08 TaxID=3120278 RepID=A0AAU7CRI8_9BACT